MNPMVSIIVPVYNAQDYLERCVDSILNQEYDDFEVILVDDGSTDLSGEICDRYRALDTRVRVLHKENTGVSDSRNLAIEQAKGTWLQFLDSDDWITPDATRLLVRGADSHGCDMVIADFYRVVGERVSRKGDIEEGGVMTRSEFAEHMMEDPADFYYGVLWNKLYRRSIVEEYGLRMDTGINWCEDFMFNLEYLMHADRIYALQAPIYYYVKRKGSLASQGYSITKTIRMKMTVFEYYNDFYKNVYDEKDYDRKRVSVYRFLIATAGDGAVAPGILPSVKKLGAERSNVKSEAVEGDSLLSEMYRSRKLLERYLEIAALKNDLELDEAALLLALKQAPMVKTRQELADLVGVPEHLVTMLLKRLAAKELLKVTPIKPGKPERREKKEKAEKQERRYSIAWMPGTEQLLADLESAEKDFEEARFADFTEEERLQWLSLCDKMKSNALRVLR